MSQASIAPSEIYTPYEITRNSLQNDTLSLERWLVSPGEVDIPPRNQHMLVFQLNNTNRRHLIQLGGQEFDGVWQQSSFSLVPANVPLFCSWDYTIEKLVLLIDPMFIRRMALETDLLNPERVELKPIYPRYDAQIESIAKLFEQELANNTESPVIGTSLYLDSLTTVLGIHLLRNYGVFQPKIITDTQGLPSSKLRQAIAYIQDHLEQDISLSAIAKYLDMSQYHFSRWFKQSMGVPPYEYVIQQRIERAKVLLQNKELSMADIALGCGFNSQSHLIRHFKKQVGITPKRYREL